MSPQKATIEKRIAILFAVITAILIAASAVSYLSIARFLEISTRVEHSHQVLDDLKSLMSCLKDAESGQRGFLLTQGKEEYLGPYREAIVEVGRKSNEFSVLTRDDPVRQRWRIEEFERLIARKLEVLDETISLYKAGDSEAALRLVNSDLGKHLMDQIRAEAGQLKSFETEQLETFGEEGRRVQNRMIAITVACFLTALAVLVTVYRLVRHELTERRRSEEAQGRLADILEATTDFVGIFDMSGRVLYVSRAGRKMVGKNEEDVPWSRIADYHPAWALKIIEDEGIPTAIREGKWFGETAILLSDGSEIPVSQVILSHEDSLGGGRYVSTIARDITERRRTETAIRLSRDELEQRVRERTAELERANNALRDEVAERWKAVEEARRACDAAEMATRAKGDFLANMSHEIRTPMNGVLGMLDLVIRSGLPRRQHEFLTLAKSSGETLLRLLNDILDFSKIEAGRLDLESTPFSIHEALGDSLKSLGMQVHEKGLKLSCSIAPDVPEGLTGDPGRLGQVVGNLVSNAQKFTDRGEIVVRVELESQDEEGVLLHISVRDTGIGIPVEKQGLIFAPFTQADSSTTRLYGGTGLGLAISTHLVRAMGGRIWLESELGVGSTFHFTARFGPHHNNLSAPSQQRLDLNGLPVLVVDDDPMQCRILEELLAGWGMRPKLMNSGPTAIAALNQARQAGEPYPLVLLDVRMPWMDGFDVAEWIHRDPDLAGTAVMLLSSADIECDPERCASLGVSVFLRKPVKASELFDSVLKVLGIASATRVESSSVEPPSLPEPARRLRILLAEDTPVNQRLAVSLLEDRGHTVVVANDGQEAVDLLATRAFDLVLMDVQMPRMDGFQATAAIRADEAQTDRRIPIIAMTAHAMKGDCERCLASGMDGYISKPIRADRFLSVIEGWTTPSVGRDATGGRGDEDRQADVVFDFDSALARARGKRSLLSKMCELFLAEYPGVMAEIHSAVLAGDPRMLERAGHRLKGSAGSLCAPRVVEAARRLEEIGRAGDLAKAEPVRVRLEYELSRFKRSLKVWEKGDSA